MTDALHDTISGDRGLYIEEPLIFEQDSPGAIGVDWPAVEASEDRLGGLGRDGAIGLPSLAEPTVVRHYTRLSQKNYGIDTGLFPLGSCTMKHNPRLNERLARLPGFADIHPLQPESTVQGALRLCRELQRWLTVLTGMPCVALTPGAGAHGELCGMMAIRAALDARGEDSPARQRVLVPDSAHGTNPATAAALGFQVVSVPEDARGRVDPARFEALLADGVAAIMLTNPNTCGVFENDIRRIADAVHEAGGYFYCDGANFNAIVGRVRPGDLGVDAMHINLHKTFSTPHGGGGPGAGPVVFSDALAPYAPVPRIVEGENGLLRLEEANGDAFGRMKAFHGQMGMFVRALAYLMSHGSDGLRQVSGDAVLNAQLRAAAAGRRVFRALCPRRPGHARGTLRRPFPARQRRDHARHCQGNHRRGTAPHDHLLPTGGARRHAGGADRDGNPCQSRPLHRHHARLGRAGKGRRCVQRGAASCSPPPPR